MASSAGEAQLRVTLAGEHIAGSPFATRVRAGSAAASCSSAHGEGLRGAVAGEAAALSLRMRDQLGNGAPSASPPRLRLVAAGGGAAGGAAGGVASGVVGVVSVGEGGTARVEGVGGLHAEAWVHAATWSCEVAGDYQLEILLGAEHIAGSPFRVRVVPAAAHPAACRLIAAGAPSLRASMARRPPLAVAELRPCGFSRRAWLLWGGLALPGGETVPLVAQPPPRALE